MPGATETAEVPPSLMSLATLLFKYLCLTTVFADCFKSGQLEIFKHCMSTKTKFAKMYLSSVNVLEALMGPALQKGCDELLKEFYATKLFPFCYFHSF